MALATNLGFPRIGADRELKKAVEAYWKGKSSEGELMEAAKLLRARHWELQKKAGLDHIPSGDFSLYDQVLDMTCVLGLIPARYKQVGENIDLTTYFAMARGLQKGGIDVTAMEMTKWFDTNYHFIVPEFEQGMSPRLASSKFFDQFQEAMDLGIKTRPVLIGPATYVLLGKPKYDAFDAVDFVRSLLPVYKEILAKLSEMGAEWVQIDEPILALDLDDKARDVIRAAYDELKASELKVLVATYFDTQRDNTALAFSLPVDAVHVDLCRGSGQANTAANDAARDLDVTLAACGDKMLSLGVIDGRNIWRNDLNKSFELLMKAVGTLGLGRVMVAPSCSLLHTPVDLNSETDLDEELRGWLAFAVQKLDEIATLGKGLKDSKESIEAALAHSAAVQEARRSSESVHNVAVAERLKGVDASMKARASAFAERAKKQRAVLNLPLYPSTSIGSFPQTQEIRKARAAFKKGEIDATAYDAAMKQEIRTVVDYQHQIGIDVLVHGEPERNDMVEYFGEQLKGFAFTKKGWVQSYGSRCVKPPIIFGDVSRPNPMTVEWSRYAQEQTDQIMKGMLTGPVTILQWSFVRDDQPRSLTAQQIALAIRDEVADLEEAGIKMIQIDEAAFREGLPLRKADWKAYLDSAVENFKLASCCVRDETQIHTHMCYSEFNDVIDSIAAMDADVISIETSRSQMELLEAFAAFDYPNEIGPGVYDIHSPRVPSEEEMVALLEKAEKVLDRSQLWVNPDCGLKTRGWPEVKPALENMVKAAKTMRERAGARAA